MSDATEAGQAVEATHSPLPWTATEFDVGWSIDSADGRLVVDVHKHAGRQADDAQDAANAALVLRAVHNHESLLAALVDEVAVLRTLATDPGLLTAADLLERADRLVALVTKARGGR